MAEKKQAKPVSMGKQIRRHLLNCVKMLLSIFRAVKPLRSNKNAPLANKARNNLSIC
jgi:hypothetical protein